MFDLNLSNTGVAATIVAVGVILIILDVVNLRGSRRLRALFNREAELLRKLREFQDDNAGLDMKLAAAERKLTYVRTYAAKVDGTENTVYKAVVRELRGILDAEPDECGNFK